MKLIDRLKDATNSTERLIIISNHGSQCSSMAAERALEKRARRLELIQKGFSFQEAVMIVNAEILQRNEE